MPRPRLWPLAMLGLLALALLVLLPWVLDRSRRASTTNGDVRAEAERPDGSGQIGDGSSSAARRTRSSASGPDSRQYVDLVGRVYSPSGEPLAGVEVTGDQAWARTDEEGAFTLRLPAPKDYTISAIHDDYAPAMVGPIWVTPNNPAGILNIRLKAGGCISGRVIDELGRPVGGACIRFNALEQTSFRHWSPGLFDRWLPRTTDPDGSFATCLLPEGDYEVRIVSARGGLIAGEPVRVHVRDGLPTGSVTLVLGGGCTISGRVVDLDGEPIPSATFHTVSDLSRIERSALTDEHGFFSLVAVPEDDCQASVTADGFQRSSIAVSAPASDVVVTLRPAPGFSGRVIDAQTREPITSFILSWEFRGRLPWSRIDWGVSPAIETEDPEGRFIVDVADPGDHTLRVSADGYAVARVDNIQAVDFDRPDDILVEMVRGADVRFVVTNGEDGPPVPGASVSEPRDTRYLPPWPWEPEPTTGPDGTCTISHVEPGQTLFVVSRNDYRAQYVTVDVEPHETEKTVPVVLSIPHEISVQINGRVVAQSDGRPLPGARVEFVVESRIIGRRTTDTHGEFNSSTAVEGNLRLDATCEHFDPASVSIPLEQHAELWPVIELPDCARISGRVVSGAGDPMRGVRVSLGFDQRVEENTAYGGDEITGEDGRYTIEASRSGHGILSASAGAVRLEEAVLLDPGQELRVDFVFDGAGLRGTVTTAGKGVPRLKVKLAPGNTDVLTGCETTAEAETDKTGTYRIGPVPPGAYNVEVREPIYYQGGGPGNPGHRCGGDLLWSGHVEIGAGIIEFNVNLERQAGARVSGTVTLPNGRPAEGADVWAIKENSDDARLVQLAPDKRTYMPLGDLYPGPDCDDDGGFSFYRMDPGPHVLAVHHVGCALSTTRIDKVEGVDLTDVRVVLEPEADLFAEMHTDTGAELGSIQVWIFDDEGHFLDDVSTYGRGDSARCRIPGLGTGRYALEAVSEGHALCRREVTTRSGAQTTVTFDLQPGHTLDIEARDSSGAPLANAAICLDPGGSAPYAKRFVQRHGLRLTARDGQATFDHLSDSAYTLHVRCSGYEDAAVPVTIAGGDKEVAVTLQRRSE